MKVRKQSGCVVFRYDPNFNYEVLLVESSDRKSWVFPKGGVEKNLSSKVSAMKEVFEEAGVAGRIQDTLGSYEYTKGGRKQSVVMYSMLYTHDTPTWPEKGLRKRKWVSTKKAKKMLSKRLRVFIDKLEENRMKALASVKKLAVLESMLRETALLTELGAVIELGESLSIKVSHGDRVLDVDVSEWGQHPMSQRLTVAYHVEHEDGDKSHFKHTSLDSAIGVITRIIGNFIRS